MPGVDKFDNSQFVCFSLYHFFLNVMLINCSHHKVNTLVVLTKHRIFHWQPISVTPYSIWHIQYKEAQCLQRIVWVKPYPPTPTPPKNKTYTFLVLPSSSDEKTRARDLTLFLGILYWALSPNLSTITASGNMENTYSSSVFILCSTESWVSWAIPAFNFTSSMYPLPNLFFKCWVGPRHLPKFYVLKSMLFIRTAKLQVDHFIYFIHILCILYHFASFKSYMYLLEYKFG